MIAPERSLGVVVTGSQVERVSDVRRAIHIRTFRRRESELVDAWLERHRLEVTLLEDVLEACTFLLTRFDAAPDLAFVGAEGFGDGDAELLGYLRETWPHLAIVVYSGAALIPLGHDVNLTVCCAEPTLRELLASSPVELAARVRRVPLERLVSMHEPGAGADDCGPQEPDDASRVGNPESARKRFGLERLDAAAPTALLTAEELAALLDATDD